MLGKQTSPSHASSEGGIVVVSEDMGDGRGQEFDMPLCQILVETSCLSVKIGGDFLWAYLVPSHSCLLQ